MKPTLKQQEVLNAIKKFIEFHEYPPTVRDIAKIMKVSPGTIQRHLENLRKIGAINRKKGVSRSITINNQSEVKMKIFTDEFQDVIKLSMIQHMESNKNSIEESKELGEEISKIFTGKKSNIAVAVLSQSLETLIKLVEEG